MKNLKKLVSVVLSLAMVISAMTFTASAKTYGDVEASSKYAEAVDILSSLKILQGDEEGNFNGDAEIKRSEFAAVVCRAMGQENAAQGSANESRFTDVASNHWAAGYINWAAGQKIVNGKGDGIFDPDAPVKYEEAIKMLVAALGYEPLATRKGGYPTGYMVVAASNGINSGVSLAGSANAPRYVVAQLTYNALDVPLMDSSYITKNGQDEYNIYDGTDYARRTVLSYYLDVTKVKATVTDNGVANNKLIDKDGSQKVTMTLTNAYKFDWEDILDGTYEKGDSITCYVGDTNAADYLGYGVIAYIAENENDDYEIVAITSDAKSADSLEVVITADNVDECKYKGTETDGTTTAKTVFSYFPSDTSRAEDVDLVEAPEVYMNGFKLAASDAKKAFDAIKTKASKVVFMGDRGEDYDKVFITQYAYAVVDEVKENDSVIKLLESTKGVGNRLVLDAEDRENSKFVYSIKDEKGAALALSDIEEGDVLNILCSKPESVGDQDINTMEIIVTKGAVEGTVDSEEEANKVYSIDGTNYDIYNEMLKLEVGESGRFFLTIDGKIFAEDENYEGDADTNKDYGFVIKTGGYDDGLDGVVYQVKMVTSDGAISTYEVASTVSVYDADNTGKKLSRQSLRRNKGEQEAYFGTTSALYAATAAADADGVKANAPKRIIQYKLNANGEIKEVKTAAYMGTSAAINASYKENSEKFANKEFTSKSVLFGAEPKLITSGTDNGKYNVDENDVEILSFTGLDEDETYANTYLIDTNSKNQIGLALITSNVSANKKSSLAVVTAVATVTGDLTKVTFFQNGETNSYNISENCDELNALGVGDIFQYSLAGDEIVKGAIIYDYNETDKTGTLVGTNSGKISFRKLTNIYEVKNRYLVLDNEEGETVDFAKGDAVGTVAKYNMDRSARSAVTKLADLSSLEENSTKVINTIIVRMDDGEIVDAIEYQTSAK